jgi:hypothetical protein
MENRILMEFKSVDEGCRLEVQYFQKDSTYFFTAEDPSGFNKEEFAKIVSDLEFLREKTKDD